MINLHTEGSPLHAEPVLAVRDVVKTVDYWHNVLGFPGKWTWGEPPNHGGVSWNGAFIQFYESENQADAYKGNWIFIKVRNLEELYAYHQKQNAEIAETLENKPWGMAAYTVKDLNGYYISFAGARLGENKEKSGSPAPKYAIHSRLPDSGEYRRLAISVGWTPASEENILNKLLSSPVYGVIAEDSNTHNVIGCAMLLGDNASFYYVKDVIVHPDWQSKGVGSAMMRELSRWLESNGEPGALVALITTDELEPFYKQFGFVPGTCMLSRVPG